MNSSVATTLRAQHVPTSTRWKTLRSTSIIRPNVLARSISASTRRICFATASAWSFMCARAGWPRPRRAADSEAVGDPARVLALDEAQDLSFPGHGEELESRRAHYGEDCVAGSERGRQAGQHRQAHLSSYIETLLCNPHAGSRSRSAHHPDSSGTRQAL